MPGTCREVVSGGYDDAMAGHPASDFKFHHQPLQYFQNLAPGTPAQKAHLQDYKDIVRDIEQNTLPQVVFYKPIGSLNQHPGYANVTDGDRHLAELVGRLQKSAAYKDMLILIRTTKTAGSGIMFLRRDATSGDRVRGYR